MRLRPSNVTPPTGCDGLPTSSCPRRCSFSSWCRCCCIASRAPGGKRTCVFRQERVGLGGGRYCSSSGPCSAAGTTGVAELIARELRGEDTVENDSSKLNNDSRVTRTGAFLRKTSLDELRARQRPARRHDPRRTRPCLKLEGRDVPEESSPLQRAARPHGAVAGQRPQHAGETLDISAWTSATSKAVHCGRMLDILLRTVPALSAQQRRPVGRRALDDRVAR